MKAWKLNWSRARVSSWSLVEKKWQRSRVNLDPRLPMFILCGKVADCSWSKHVCVCECECVSVRACVHMLHMLYAAFQSIAPFWSPSQSSNSASVVPLRSWCS